jgi:cysteine-rich repeat protein
MRPIPTPHALLVPLAVVALATACEEPPPVEGVARLFASAADAEVVQGQSTQITVTSIKADGSVGTGDITATISPENVGRIAASGVPPTELSATAALNAQGLATFDFACDVSGSAEPATATITLEGATGEATASVTCTPQIIRRNIVLSILDCQARLQADGASFCNVDVSVRNATGVAVEGVPLDVTVESATPAGGGNGDTSVLKEAVDDQQAVNRLDDVLTDANGAARFVVVSPAFGLEQTMRVNVVDDTGNSGSADITIGPFLDRSEVTLSASTTSTSSNSTLDITVTARQLNGDPAVGTATVDVPAPLTATAGGCLTATAEPTVFTALLENGSCTFTATAGDVGNQEQTATVKAIFQAPNGALRRDELPIIINPVGVSIANVSVDETAIFADGQDPTTATITVELTPADALGAVVTATVASSSGGIIKLATQKVGASVVPVANEDLATATSDAAGLIEFTVIADTAASRGNGTITITVVDAAGQPFDDVSNSTLTITVDREPLLSSLVFDGFDPDSVIGVPGGPRPSSTGVKFKLLDEQNNPVANVPVRFAAQSSVPGISVVPFATSDSSGVVNTVVTAGRVAGPITVVAIVDSPALSAVSPAISVIGGLPNSAYSSIVCDTVAAQNPSTDCTVVLADKFTNLVETDINVQFRAEGGNITPSAEASGGTATASFIAGPPGAGSADVRNWSYSPLRTPPTAVIAAFASCFDATTRTTCDLVALCTSADPAIRAFCPLPPSASGQPTSCASDIDVLALDALSDESGNPGDWEFSLFTNLNSAAFTASEVRAQFDEYLISQRACGITLGCLVGDQNGLSLDDSDDCPVNAGCLDFTGATECPQDGLLDVLAAVRGEEGFDDENGNGVHDAGEDFVDFPEPFLDKNSSCSYDSLNDNQRLTASQKIQLSDLFIDSDSTDGLFGFNIGGDRFETNGAFDTDTEVFLKTSIVQLGAPSLQFGFEVSPGVCGADGTANVACPAGAQAADGAQSRCTETARGEAILESCLPGGDNFRDGDLVTYAFRWTDRNGNCPTANFSGQPSVTVEGPAELRGVNDLPYSQSECGAVPGGAGSKNLERPWCEEHLNMGAPAREVTLIGKCDGETGNQPITLIFTLDGVGARRTFVLSCPVCGDDLLEGEEQCDDGNRAVGDGCDADCAVEAP